MKSIVLFLMMTLLLTACVEKDDSLKAHVSDFKDSGFRNNNGKVIVLVEDGIMVSGTLRLHEKKKSSIDEVLEKENAESDQLFNKMYHNGKIETKGSTYYVMLDDDFSLIFEKVGERIIEDAKGVEYFTKES